MEVGIRPNKHRDSYLKDCGALTTEFFHDLEKGKLEDMLDLDAIVSKWNKTLLFALRVSTEEDTSKVFVECFSLRLPLDFLRLKEFAFIRHACEIYCTAALRRLDNLSGQAFHKTTVAKRTTPPNSLALVVPAPGPYLVSSSAPSSDTPPPPPPLASSAANDALQSSNSTTTSSSTRPKAKNARMSAPPSAFPAPAASVPVEDAAKKKCPVR